MTDSKYVIQGKQFLVPKSIKDSVIAECTERFHTDQDSLAVSIRYYDPEIGAWKTYQHANLSDVACMFEAEIDFWKSVESLNAEGASPFNRKGHTDGTVYANHSSHTNHASSGKNGNQRGTTTVTDHKPGPTPPHDHDQVHHSGAGSAWYGDAEKMLRDKQPLPYGSLASNVNAKAIKQAADELKLLSQQLQKSSINTTTKAPTTSQFYGPVTHTHTHRHPHSTSGGPYDIGNQSNKDLPTAKEGVRCAYDNKEIKLGVATMCKSCYNESGRKVLYCNDDCYEKNKIVHAYTCAKKGPKSFRK